MAATDIVKADLDGDDDVGLSDRQIAALEKLEELGAAPAEEGPDGKLVFDSRPQVRAYQLIFADKFGGAGRGQGRRARQPRAAEVIATKIRENHRVKRIIETLDRALDEEAGPRANLDAVKLMMDIENKEAALRLREDESDKLGDTKEELLATLFGLAGGPAVAAVIEGQALDITDAEIIEVKSEDITPPAGGAEVEEAESRHAPAARANGSDRDPASAKALGRDGRVTGSDVRKRSARDRSEGPNPVLAAKRRRAK